MIKEEEFIKQTSIYAFNEQFNRLIDPAFINVKSITNSYTSKYAFELWSSDVTPALRIRVYIYLGDVNQMSPYRLEVDRSSRTGNVGDEVYVSHATIGGYTSMSLKLDWYYQLMASESYLLAEDGSVFIMELGNFILLES